MQSGTGQNVSGVSESMLTDYAEKHDSKITSAIQHLEELKSLLKEQKDG